MENQTFTNSTIEDKQIVALQSPTAAPTGRINVFDVTKDENELVLTPPITQSNIGDLANVDDSTSKAKMKRLVANRMYAARHRLRKEAKIQELIRHIDNLQAEVSIIQSHLLTVGATYNKLVEENEKLKAYWLALTKKKAEKDAEKWALIQEINRLRNNQYY
ncbi:Basic-leucine zipper domain [Sesbania bispinosa]|nr:Basic-leucine zipper domain [Sesbania bispinosa]